MYSLYKRIDKYTAELQYHCTVMDGPRPKSPPADAGNTSDETPDSSSSFACPNCAKIASAVRDWQAFMKQGQNAHVENLGPRDCLPCYISQVGTQFSLAFHYLFRNTTCNHPSGVQLPQDGEFSTNNRGNRHYRIPKTPRILSTVGIGEQG